MSTSFQGAAGPSSVYPSPQQRAPVENQAPAFSNSLWRLAKTAELKKHTLTMQLQTAHIHAAQHALDLRKLTLEDIKAQRNWLESEKLNLLKQLELVNADRDRATELETRMQQECEEFSRKLRAIADGDYAAAKKNVDAIRAELELTPSRPLQSVLDEKSANYLQERRLASLKRSAAAAEDGASVAHADNHPFSMSTSTGPHHHIHTEATTSTSIKRNADAASDATGEDAPPAKKRGRPKGSKNKVKAARD